MNLKFCLIVLACVLLLAPRVHGQEFTYDAIAKRYDATKLDQKSVVTAKMHGECMVGLKRLIFVKRENFDPVAEWVNYRALSLLEQFPPCEVLIMMQVARAELMGESAAGKP